MNLFAHAVLAGTDPVQVAAGIVADRIKSGQGNPLFDSLPLRVQKGVLQHRAIDSFTDAHPLMGQAREYFPPPVRRISGILLDLYGDWVLYNHWVRWPQLGPLNGRVEWSRECLRNNIHCFPEKAAEWGLSIIQWDLLGACTQWNGLCQTAYRLGARIQLQSSFSQGLEILKEKSPRILGLYLEFLDDLLSSEHSVH